MGGFIPLIQQIVEEEGPVVEEEAVVAGEAVAAEAQALEQKAEVAAEAVTAEAKVLAQEVESEGKAIFNKLEDALSPEDVGQVEVKCQLEQATGEANAIEESLASTNPGTRLEGEVAQGLKNSGLEVSAFQTEVGPNGSIGEVDIETPQAIIETTVSPAGKLGQVTKLLTNTAMNPGAKPVILYAPNYGSAASSDIVSAGAYVVKNMDELTDLLKQLGGM